MKKFRLAFAISLMTVFLTGCNGIEDPEIEADSVATVFCPKCNTRYMVTYSSAKKDHSWVAVANGQVIASSENKAAFSFRCTGCRGEYINLAFDSGKIVVLK